MGCRVGHTWVQILTPNIDLREFPLKQTKKHQEIAIWPVVSFRTYGFIETYHANSLHLAYRHSIFSVAA